MLHRHLGVYVMLGCVAHVVRVVVRCGVECVGVEVAEIGVHRGLAVQICVETTVASHGGHRCHAAVHRLSSGGHAGHSVLVVQFRQRSHEAFREPLLLIGDIFGAEELRRGRRGGN